MAFVRPFKPREAAWLAALLFGVTQAQAGKLGELRRATGHDAPSRGGSSDDDDDDDDGCSWLAILLFGCDDDDDTYVPEASVSRPEPVDWARIEREQRARDLGKPRYFLPYPYAAGHSGNLLPLRLPAPERMESTLCSADEAECLREQHVAVCVDDNCYRPKDRQGDAQPRPKRLRTTRLQLFADGGADTDGLVRGTVGLVGDGVDFGVDTRWTLWAEDLGGEQADSLTLADANLRYHLLSLRALQVAVGLGGRGLFDGAGATLGVNTTVAAELYPVRPLVVRLEGDAGTLGAAPLWEWQTTAGVTFRNAEIYAGYADLHVEDIRFASVFAGLRLTL